MAGKGLWFPYFEFQASFSSLLERNSCIDSAFGMPGGNSDDGITLVYARRHHVLTTPELSRGNGEDLILTVTGSPIRSPRANTSRSRQYCHARCYRESPCQQYPAYQSLPAQGYQGTKFCYQAEGGQKYYPINEEFQYMETYLEGPMSRMRRKSLEGLTLDSSMQPPHRVLDVHNLDPPYWIPLQAVAKEKSSLGFLGRKRTGGHSFGGKISQTLSQHSKLRKSPQTIKIDKDSQSLQYIDGSSQLDVNVNESSGFADNLYPIFLPMDQAFKTKYVFATRKKKGKTLQERVYTFLEHPTGWTCFAYHFIV